MQHWLLDKINNTRIEALKLANQELVYQELLNTSAKQDYAFIQRTAEALEMVILDLILDRYDEDDEKAYTIKSCAADAFRLYRVIPRMEAPLQDAAQRLRMCSLAVLGDMGADAARLLRETTFPNLPFNSEDWGERTWATILDVWLRLIRKQGWTDRDAVLERVAFLRESQQEFEKNYLVSKNPMEAKAAAFEL
ncbi:MAG: hypothetical protein WAO57_00825, partial [Syntrophomonadaceae bacterium]